MTFIKGKSGNPTGRPKGAEGRVTKEAKNLFKDFISNNQENLQTDYDKLRRKHPERALEVLMRVAEFVYPKLSRTAVTDGDGNKLFVTPEAKAKTDQLLTSFLAGFKANKPNTKRARLSSN